MLTTIQPELMQVQVWFGKYIFQAKLNYLSNEDSSLVRIWQGLKCVD